MTATTDREYYNLHTLLSRNGQFNFVVGMRGNGKTFAFKNWAIRDFIKNKNEFIYLRRYKSELEDRSRFFDDIAWKYPDYEIRVEGYKAQIRLASAEEKNPHEWQTFGYFVTLANAVTKKSTPYKRVTKIGFDEFILDRGHIHYLPEEVRAFQDFYNTVDRWEDRVRVVFMANSVSIMNPYFIAYDIRPDVTREFTSLRDGFIVVQYIQTPAFREGVTNTRFGRMLAGTAYYSYAIDNVFRDDNDLFVRRKPATAKFYYALTFDNRTVGVWVDYEGGEYYVSTRYPADSDMVFALTKQDMKPNLLMIERTSGLLLSMKKLYMQGSVFFDSPRTREFMNDVFNFINLR